jgi:hypothetical protein
MSRAARYIRDGPAKAETARAIHAAYLRPNASRLAQD